VKIYGNCEQYSKDHSLLRYLGETAGWGGKQVYVDQQPCAYSTTAVGFRRLAFASPQAWFSLFSADRTSAYPHLSINYKSTCSLVVNSTGVVF